MRISNIKVHFQISAGSQINAGGVYFKFDRVHLVLNREKMVKKMVCPAVEGNRVSGSAVGMCLLV